MKKLSVIIPSFKDPLLQKTIQSLLENSEIGDQLEIIAVLDGYWIAPEFIVNDPRVIYLHLGANGGMKNAINQGVAISKGEYIMRIDEHCSFGPGYDRILIEDATEGDLWTARRYFLDPVKWEVMDIPPVDYEKLIIMDAPPPKFTGQRWTKRTEERKDILVDETMMVQGSMVMMSRKHWDTVIGRLHPELYGAHYQDQIEMAFKTWKVGGRIMVNKKTWFAHKHRSFPRTHKYGGKDAYDGWAYSLRVWGDYYNDEIVPKWGI